MRQLTEHGHWTFRVLIFGIGCVLAVWYVTSCRETEAEYEAQICPTKLKQAQEHIRGLQKQVRRLKEACAGTEVDCPVLRPPKGTHGTTYLLRSL